MFDCCRVPGPQGLDWSISYAKAGDSGDSGHIVVFRHNRAWKVEATSDGRILSTAEIEKYGTIKTIIFSSIIWYKDRFNTFMITLIKTILVLAF